MDWLILVLLAAAFLASLLASFLLRSAPKSPRTPVMDGDHYDVDEMLAAFGIGQDWV